MYVWWIAHNPVTRCSHCNWAFQTLLGFCPCLKARSHSIRIAIRIGWIAIECAVVVFTLHFWNSRGYLVHVTYRGMKMASVNVIAALVFFCMKYVWLRWKHKRERICSHTWGFRATPLRWAWTSVWSRTLINFLVSSVVYLAPAIVSNTSQQRTLPKAIWSNEHQRLTWCSLLRLIDGSHARVFYSRNRIEGTWVTCTCFLLAKPDRRDWSGLKLPREVVWLNAHWIRIIVNEHSVWTR